ncbi:MAG: MBOAT family protein [Defluviitaleaceae bacterium]|nr:MBOAT family protein [Defluviitaleaceae bacterium]
MLFTSSAFVAFMAIVLILYRVFPQRHRWFVLLVASMTFYGFAGPSFLFYITATIVCTYICTTRIRLLRNARDNAVADTVDKTARKAIRAKAKAACKRWFVACLLVTLGLLAIAKYTDFVIGNANSLLGLIGSGRRFGFMHLALPMGISFYTFQTVGYIIDVYREKTTPLTNPFKLALFVSFFPQVIQGPISRFDDLSQTLYSGTPVNRHGFTRAAQRILIGFFKKLVIADRLWPALLVLIEAPDEFRGAFYLFSILLYAIILFADFTGGLDITIGIAEIFGIRLAENFNRPFYSRSTQEYWQRWHITMYTWFRDYVFYPVSVGKSMLRFSKFSRRFFGDGIGKRLPVHITLLWTWFLTGFWHGATWNFVAWGLANGIVIMVSLELAPLYERFHKVFPSLGEKKFYRIFQIFRTFWLMNMIRSFDIYPGVMNAFRLMLSVITEFDLSGFISRNISELTLPISDYVSAGIGLLVLFWLSWLGRGGIDFRDKWATFAWPVRYGVVGAILFTVLILGAYGHGYDARQFIYNQF